MSDVVIVGLLSLAGSIVGTLGGIMAAQKLTNYKIEQLQKAVEKHNGVMERTFKLEGQMTEVQHDIMDLKKAR